ncbi:MAG: signal recognition particle protein [Erysipelotrichaceae bacterium]
MAFDNLSNKLNKTFRNIIGKGKLSEKNMEDMLLDIREALIEADVNYRVVQLFLTNIKERFLGSEVSLALDPDQQVLKIVKEELIKLLGNQQADLIFNMNGLTTMMLVGLQGSGKTTAAAKLANLLKAKQSKKVLLIAADLYRPAAITQLQVLAESIAVEVFSQGLETSVVDTVKAGLQYASSNKFDVVIIDTAGLLHIEEKLMSELKEIEAIAKCNEILLTVDSMSGQDVVNVAKSFKDSLNITGLIATKFDGDSRGGGVLSVKAVTELSIKLVSQGEKISDLDYFYPERMAERILGMGDLLTLIEQAEEKLDAEVNEKAMARMMKGEFSLQDMLDQFLQVEKLGPLSGVMKMLPGMGDMSKNIDDQQVTSEMSKQIAIIRSMTAYERENPDLIRKSRQYRIASGAGVKLMDVSKLLANHKKMKKQMGMITQLANAGSLPDFSKLF